MKSRIKMYIRRILSLALFFLLLPAALWSGARAETESIGWLYTFIPREALEGEGTAAVNELLNALQLRMDRQLQDQEMIFRVEVLSEGNLALSLTAQEDADEVFALACSLTGDNVLLCGREQIPSFLLTLVQVLADLKVLRGESLERVQELARKAGNMLKNLASVANQPAETGIDFSPYLRQLQQAATAYEEKVPDENDPPCPGAAKLYIYHLSEADLNSLVELVLSKFCAVPVISEALSDGSLKIGSQVITDTYIRRLFASMHGESVLYHYEDADGRMIRLFLQTPDISALTEDPDFAKVSGVDITIQHEEHEDGTRSSITDCSLPGLDKAVMSIRLDEGPGEPLTPLSMKNTHQVDEINSKDMLELIHSMGLLIVRNAVNMVLVLPRCVFDMLVGKLF